LSHLHFENFMENFMEKTLNYRILSIQSHGSSAR